MKRLEELGDAEHKNDIVKKEWDELSEEAKEKLKKEV